MPKRIQRKRAKGWRMPPNTVYVGRPTVWGNPFTVGAVFFKGESFFDAYGHLMHKRRDGGAEVTPENCLSLFHAWCEKHFALMPNCDWLEPLRGMDLACWCREGAPCHADILLRLANDNDTASASAHSSAVATTSGVST